MTCLLKRVLPFTLTLGLGIALGSLVTYQSSRLDTTVSESLSSNTAPLSINNVPELDFTDAARRTDGLSGTLRLRVLLGADGRVWKVEPEVILPYGVTDVSSVETGRMGRPTPFITDGRFVERLPYGLTDAAIEAAKQIQFTPAIKDGEPVSTAVTITDEFNLITSPDCVPCSSITTTVMDDGGVKWHKMTPRENTYYYRTHHPNPLFVK